MQTESNAGVQEGVEVRYVSYGNHSHRARVLRLFAHEYGDLLVQTQCLCCHHAPAERRTIIRQAAYDSDGQQKHSWHKTTDRMGKVATA